jgi:hypothetical protein
MYSTSTTPSSHLLINTDLTRVILAKIENWKMIQSVSSRAVNYKHFAVFLDINKATINIKS